MTISSSSRTAGPFVGTGAVVGYPFGFKVFAASDVKVVHTNTAGVDDAVWVLGSNYTVALNANQNTSPGGTVTPTVALPVGEKITLSSAVPAVQGTALTSAGSWDPRTVEDALDRATILVQQLSQSAATPGVPSAVAVVPASVAAASAGGGGGGAVFDATLPVPVANSVITINSTATGFTTTPVASLGGGGGGGGLAIVPATFTPTATCQGLPPALYHAQQGYLAQIGTLVFFSMFVSFDVPAGGAPQGLALQPNFPSGVAPASDTAVAAYSSGTVDTSGMTENVVNALLSNATPPTAISLFTTTTNACGAPGTMVQINVSGVFSTV